MLIIFGLMNFGMKNMPYAENTMHKYKCETNNSQISIEALDHIRKICRKIASLNYAVVQTYGF